jgi:hypothetical protein
MIIEWRSGHSRVESSLHSWPAALRADHDHDLSPTLFGGVYSAMDSLAAAGVLASEQSSAAEREAAYVSIESCLRAAAEGGGDDTRLAAVELAVACSEPLASSVLCAPSSRVGAVEWRRASLLLVEMAKLDPIAVCGKTIRRNDEGSKPVFAVWTASGTAFAEMLAKGKDEWDLDDAVTAAVNAAWWVCFYQVGASAVLGPIGEGYEMEILGEFLAAVPYWGTSNDRFVPLALLCVDLLREPAGQPEAVLAGAWKVVCMVAVGRPLNGRAIWEAGVVGVMQTALRQYTPIERVSISEGQLVPTGLFIGIKDVRRVRRVCRCGRYPGAAGRRSCGYCHLDAGRLPGAWAARRRERLRSDVRRAQHTGEPEPELSASQADRLQAAERRSRHLPLPAGASVLAFTGCLFGAGLVLPCGLV